MKQFLFVGIIGVAVFAAGLAANHYWHAGKNAVKHPPIKALETTLDADATWPVPPEAGPVPDCLKPINRQPLIERMLKFNRTSLAGAYEKVGKKNPLWDEHAMAAMEAVALFFSGSTNPRADAKDVRAATQKAIDAGCDDPLVLYMHVRCADATTPHTELEQGYAKAADAMMTSAYPPIRKIAALQRAGEYKMKRQTARVAVVEALQYFGNALLLMPASAREDEIGVDLESGLHNALQAIFKAHRDLGHEPLQTLRDFDKVLMTEKKLESARLHLYGKFYVDWAWEARGTGVASTVSREAWQKFDLRLTNARAALEKACELTPEFGPPAALMITVELGQSSGREEMEKWFERAMKCDPSPQVCGQKLNWLHPKWHGSFDEMLAFAHACRDSKNWEQMIPLTVVSAHRQIADTLAGESAKSAYYRRGDVAGDILYVYENCLRHYPSDNAMRSQYAYYCYQCGQAREAHRQFQRLGDKMSWGPYISEQAMKRARTNATMEVGK